MQQSYIYDEIQSGADELNIKFRSLDKNESLNYYRNLSNKYGKIYPSHLPLWEKLEDSFSIHDPYAIDKIKDFKIEGKVIVLFDEFNEVIGVEFQNISQASNVLANCIPFVTYFFNKEYSYLLSLNDHDMLIGCGAVKQEMVRFYRSTCAYNAPKE